MRRLFITGLAGYLGRVVARTGREAGWQVSGTILSRTAEPGLDAYAVDVRDGAAVERVVAAAAPDAIVHTAYRRDGEAAAQVNAGGAYAVARAARRTGARLVHVSSDVVFRGDLARPLREDDPPDPITEYGASKAEAEALVSEADPGAVLVRTSLIYGGAEPSEYERLAVDAADGTIDATFYEDEIRCPVVVDDLAAALVELAELPDVGGPLHVAGPDAVSRLEFARLLAARAGRDAAALRGAPAPPTRPKNLTLDCSRARALLRARPRGVRTT